MILRITRKRKRHEDLGRRPALRCKGRAALGRPYAAAAAGKTVIDVTNSIAPPYEDLAVAGSDSGAEQVVRKLKRSRVVKAFNTISAEAMADPRYPDGPAVLPVAGDDPRAKATAIALARDLGFEPLDAGPLSMARYLEPLAMLWIKLALVQGLGRRFAFRLVQR